MMIAIIDHDGGCDHTIHCGTLVVYQMIGDENEEQFVDRIMHLHRGDIEEYNATIKFYRTEPVEIEAETVVQNWRIKR